MKWRSFRHLKTQGVCHTQIIFERSTENVSSSEKNSKSIQNKGNAHISDDLRNKWNIVLPKEGSFVKTNDLQQWEMEISSIIFNKVGGS